MTIEPAFTYTDDAGESFKVQRHAGDGYDYLSFMDEGALNSLSVDVADLEGFITALRSLVPGAEKPKVYRGPAEADS